MAIDTDYQQRLEGWHKFGRLLKWSVIGIVIVLIGMAYFLV